MPGGKNHSCSHSQTHTLTRLLHVIVQADICQLGMDQRKVNMLAREYCDAAEPKIKHKPIILSHREYSLPSLYVPHPPSPPVSVWH